ncbi:MAG: glycosyltransferase family 2 protein [bacterium]
MRLVSTITVNWNGIRYLPPFLESLFAQTYRLIEAIVVDNASTDGSLDFIRSHYPQVRLVENPENVGFCRANNQGIGIARGEYIQLLNFDLVLAPTFIEEMVRTLESGDDVGSVSGKLLRMERRGGMDVIDSTGHVIFKDREVTNRGIGEIDEGQYDAPGEVFGACGAAALYRREMLEDIAIDGEIFDELLFAYYDDIDIDWRARLMGWRCLYNPRAVAYHARGGGGGEAQPWFLSLSYRNSLYVLVKNELWVHFRRDLWRILRHHIWGKQYLFDSLWMFLRDLPKVARKRALIQGRRRAEPESIDRWFSDRF